MSAGGTLQQGRASFARRAWADAYAELSAADRESPLLPEDLERLAMAAYYVGRDDDNENLLARAHQEFLGVGNRRRAARCGFWLGMILLNRGEAARGGGWIARVRRLLNDDEPDCVEQGYVLIPAALQSLNDGDAATAHTTFSLATEIAERFGDPDLLTLARLGRGQALLHLGQVDDGLAWLDEVMIAVTAGEVSPMVAGVAYCAVIEACNEIFDLRRAQEWTEALNAWCAAQPDLVPYRGQCLVHRAEIMQLHGAWSDAIAEARLARDRLSRPRPQPAAGAAFYQLAELHRLRGEFAAAEAAYRDANRWGREPQPGLARLRLAQGQIDAAYAAIRRVLDEAQGPVARCALLPAFVEIALAAGDADAARVAVAELSAVATDLRAPLLSAEAARGEGAVLLADGDARAALGALRGAWTTWQALDAPYEVARTRVLLAIACRDVGDTDSAEMELDAARGTFERLRAAPDLARLEALSSRPAAQPPGGLTAREVQVLRLVAEGRTNRAIAADLYLSEKTVARHVSNILTKLGLPSRSAATAYAYEHDLV